MIFVTSCKHVPAIDKTGVIHLAREGAAAADIVVAEDACASVQHAAAELADFLKLVTGSSFPVVHEPGKAKYHLLVGPEAAKLANARFSTNTLGAEGIVIRSIGDNVIIAGGHPRGTLYAVYTFLEDYVGCRWWSTHASTIPRNPNLSIPKDLNVRYVPPLEYRWSFWTHINSDPDLSVRNKVNGSPGLKEPKYGGNMSHGGVHTFYLLIPPKLYFDKHPEWFSEIKGKRIHKRGQLCLSNKAMRQELTARLRETIRKNPSPPIYSVSQNDWHGYCTCKRCNELAKQYGGQSGIMLWFVNQVAEDLEKEFPDISLSTLAYQYTRKPPNMTIRPQKNVIVQLCSIECSFSVPFEHERNLSFRDDIIAWSKITDRLYVWDYVTNFRHYFLPHPNLRVLGPNIRFLVGHKVKGLFEQGAYTTLGAEFAELRGWVLAKLLWDPLLNDRELIETFVEGYYTKAAAPHILRYIDLMHDAVATSNDRLGCFSSPNQKFLSFEVLDRGWKELLAAEKAVADNAVIVNRVKMAQLPLMYAFMSNWHALRDQCRTADAVWPMPKMIEDVAKEFKRIAKANNVKRVNERENGFGLVDRILE